MKTETVTADNITDEQLASLRDDATLDIEDRIRASAALEPSLPAALSRHEGSLPYTVRRDPHHPPGQGAVSMSDQTKFHPVQSSGRGKGGQVTPSVTMLAYEVYCELYGPQEAMVTGWCRGGFSQGELIAFLYARSFPKSEWRARVDEAFAGMVWS